MLEVTGLCFDYHDKSLLHQVELILQPGELLHLRGANGAGKTTLLKLLAGLLHPQSGNIFYQKQSIYNSLPSYQKQLCFVGHRTGINSLLTVAENCFFDLNWGKKKINLSDLLINFGLDNFTDKNCGQLSAGQRRRVGLLRMVMSDAPLWLLDEPLIALDAQAITQFMCLLEEHLAQGGQVIVTSHQTLPLKAVPYLEYSL
jgi:heme exporter protein A